MDLNDIILSCQAEAIASKLRPTSDSFWRHLCRQYSKNFSTPLYVVLDMAPEHVLLHIFEERLEGLDLEEDLDKVIEMVNEIEDPDYDLKKKKETDNLIKKIEEKELDRLDKGLPVHHKIKGELKEPTLKQKETIEERKSGYLNLDYLSQNSEER